MSNIRFVGFNKNDKSENEKIMDHNHSPLTQFSIKPLWVLECAGYNISFTNSSLFMLLSVTLTSLVAIYALREKSIIPGRMQVMIETIYGLITDMVEQNIGHKGIKFSPLIFSLFLFIVVCNLLGMVPYAFTVTSHIIITFSLAILVFTIVTLIGFWNHGLHFLSLFLPRGTPLWLAPLIVLIELFAYLARPVSLSLRLAANMVAGHVLLKVLAGFIVVMAVFLKPLPIPVIVVLIGFEIFVAILQAYIFTILSCIYLNDAVNLH